MVYNYVTLCVRVAEWSIIMLHCVSGWLSGIHVCYLVCQGG